MVNWESRSNVDDYKSRRSEAKRICRMIKRAYDVEILEIMEQAHEQNEVRKFYKLIYGLKTGFQPRTSVCKDRDSRLIGDDMLIMDRWGQYFSELLNSNTEGSVSKNIVYERSEPHIEAPTGYYYYYLFSAIGFAPGGSDPYTTQLQQKNIQ
jgi:hypothetical protein